MRPAIVVTSFGVSASEAREKSLVPIVREIAEGFPEFTPPPAGGGNRYGFSVGALGRTLPGGCA